MICDKCCKRGGVECILPPLPGTTVDQCHRFSRGTTSSDLMQMQAAAESAASNPEPAQASATEPKDKSVQLLEQATAIVVGARRSAYGAPEDNFSCIAELWSAYIKRRSMAGKSTLFNPADIAAMMVLMKVARIAETQNHTDSWRDIAGYAACGARASDADMTK